MRFGEMIELVLLGALRDMQEQRPPLAVVVAGGPEHAAQIQAFLEQEKREPSWHKVLVIPVEEVTVQYCQHAGDSEVEISGDGYNFLVRAQCRDCGTGSVSHVVMDPAMYEQPA